MKESCRQRVVAATALALAASLAPGTAGAQRQTIEIRGQVPTPQVVTVRPREVPTVSRQVLVPEFYDRSFWPVILPGFQLVSRSEVMGTSPIDTVAAVVQQPAPPPAIATPAAAPAPVQPVQA
ncbi:MAG: hypothetical protein M3376_05060, partial [Actinomycetota bacterium]|nr:hypothetical protein [Actinomycetota bacterium]